MSETQVIHSKKRIEAYDVARALAILGMIIVNFKIVMGSDTTNAPLLDFATSLLEGRAAALFVILAGVSLSLLSKRARKSDDIVYQRQTQWRILKRAVFLLIFGMLLTLIWPADILHFYSLYLTFAVLILFVSDRQLWWSAIAIVLMFPILFLIFDYGAGWDWDTLTITDFWTVTGMIRHLLFNGLHPFFPWAGFLVIGLWLGRQNILRVQFRRRLLAITIITLVVIEIASALLITITTPSLGSELALSFFGREVIPPTVFYFTSATASAIIVILLLAEFNDYLPNQKWWRILSSTGQFALTIYVAHIVVGMGIMEMMGWINGNQSLVFTVGYSLLFYVLCILFTLVWQRQFKRGPFEAMMRFLTG